MICLHCGQERRTKQAAKYCSARCRARASRQRYSAGTPAVIRSIRTLKSGHVQVILHVAPIWGPQAHVRRRGENVRVGGM
jgi:hypothetical protein